MIKNREAILAITILTVLILGIMYYFHHPSTSNSKGKLSITVTILPQSEFVEKVGGDQISTIVLVPPGANPHTYEPTPSQMEQIAQADMYAKVGTPIEFELTWMEKIIETNPNMLIIDCSQGIDLIDMISPNHEYPDDTLEHIEESLGKDPHIWLSPKNAITMVENIYQGIITIDPNNKEYYSKNKQTYIQELKDIDTELNDTFSDLPTKKFLVYHPSWGYLAHDYGLEQIPIEKEGKEPTPEGITHLIDQAKRDGITVIFATPEFETRTAQTVAEEIGGSVVLISPLEKEYITNLRQISIEIAKSLR